MKILQLCNKVPYPPHDGGSVAILNMARSFVKNGHEVAIMAMSTAKHNYRVEDLPEELTRDIEFIFVDVDTEISPMKMFINLFFSRMPYIALRFDHQYFSDILVALIKKRQFDIIQLEGLYLKPYLDIIRKNSKGLVSYRAHNVENEIWRRIAENTAGFFRKWYLKILARRLEKYEQQLINQYDLLLPISNDDQHEFSQMGNVKPSHVTYHGIADNGFKKDGVVSDPKELFYIGSLDWIPNQDALSWFLDNVWVVSRSRYPDLNFHVAGRNAPEWLVSKFRKTGVTYHGEVNSSEDFIDNYSVMVVPLFAGSGLRIKIVEAMARSKAVITTKIGAQGLNITPGNEILVANTADEFRQAIENMIENKTILTDLQKNAFAFARDHFNNDRIVQNLLYFYSQHA